MTFRERYLGALTFRKVDRVPLTPGGPRESTLRVWHQQGLPEGKSFYEAMLEEIGLPPMPGGFDSPGVQLAMMPIFEEKILEHKDGHYIIQDWMGAITEISDQYDFSYIRSARDFVTRKWHKFPVETREDWERMRERYDVDTPGRFPENFEERCKSLRERDVGIAMQVNGPFWQLREWCGFENLCMLFLDDPDFVREMIDFWTEYVLKIFERIHKHIGLDRLGISEDMAYKAHSMISPEMSLRFLLPTYRQWIPEVKSAGCSVIDMDSDGYVGELIPVWIEAGINVCSPVEVAAHNDIVAYRKQFGKKMGYLGGIDKRAIAAGGSVMEAELMRVVPPLLKDGGFIPTCDHGVPPDISWPNFIAYSRLLAKLCGWL